MKLVCESINVEFRTTEPIWVQSVNRLTAIPSQLSGIIVTAVVDGRPNFRPGVYATLTADRMGGGSESVNVLVTSLACIVDQFGNVKTEIQGTAQTGDFDPKKNERFKFYVRLDGDVVAIADKRSEEIAWSAEYTADSSEEAFRVVEELNEAALVDHLDMVADDQCMGCPIENFAELQGTR